MIHRLLISLWLCALLWAQTAPARAEIAVIINLENPVHNISPSQVSDFFLGRSRSFSSGVEAIIYEMPRESALRAEFFRSLNGMTIKQLNAYWARLQFSGEVQPPPVLPESRAVLAAVRKNRNAIGYIDAALVDSSVRVVMRLTD